jgi:predicted secreted Zn-dependent protease
MNIKIPFKDPQVRFIWDCYYAGISTYEEAMKAIHKLEDERVAFLKEQGFSDEEAVDQAVDSVYDIDIATYKAQTDYIKEQFDVVPF